MPRAQSQRVLAWRAVGGDSTRRSWLHHFVAVLGVSVLGFGAASSVSVDAQVTHARPSAPLMASRAQLPEVSREPGVAEPSAFSPFGDRVGRSTARVSLVNAAMVQQADQRSDAWNAAERHARLVAQAKAVQPRTASLAFASQAAAKHSARVKAAHAKAARAAANMKAVRAKAARARAARARAAQMKAAHIKAARAKAARVNAARINTARVDAHEAAARKSATHKVDFRRASERRTAARRGHTRRASGDPRQRSRGASLPVTERYQLVARFGDTGPWSRYHTGLDFSASMGTTVRAMDSGVVAHAGSGRAGWAGRYVTIRHDDGKTTLYAHLSAVSVRDGERVSGGDRIGSVGMTGRTFGPHVHVELYPRGARTGAVYSAINPSPWMRARGLRP